MIASEYPAIETLVPHRRAMRLVERVIESNETFVTAAATFRTGSQFEIEGIGVPTYVGVELMAQAVSALDGLKSAGEGEGREIGFLLGCRRYTAHQPTFVIGREYFVSAELSFLDEPMSVFDCRIVDAYGAPVAEGAISVYLPSATDTSGQRELNDADTAER